MFVEIFIDGAARNNGIPDVPNEAACAAVIFANRKEIARYARGLGQRTNNEAEYEALLLALSMCSMSTNILAPNIYSDSLVVVNQVNRIWRTDQALLTYNLSVRIIREEYPFHLFHVPRRIVHVADSLCNEYLDILDVAKTKKGDYSLSELSRDRR